MDGANSGRSMSVLKIREWEELGNREDRSLNFACVYFERFNVIAQCRIFVSLSLGPWCTSSRNSTLVLMSIPPTATIKDNR